MKLWEVETGKLIRTLDGDALSSRQGVGALAFSPDGKRALVSGSTFELWEVETGKLLWWLKDALGGTGAAFSPDGRVLVDAVGRTIVLYDGETGKVLDRIDLATSHDRVESLALSSDGRFLCAGTARGVVLRFEVTTGGGR